MSYPSIFAAPVGIAMCFFVTCSFVVPFGLRTRTVVPCHWALERVPAVGASKDTSGGFSGGVLKVVSFGPTFGSFHRLPTRWALWYPLALFRAWPADSFCR